MTSVQKSFGKVIFYIVIMGVLLAITAPFLNSIRSYLINYVDIMTYLPYINAIIIVVIGYLIINSIAGLFYESSKDKIGVHNANLVKVMVKILGIAVLLSILTSVFNVSASAALTLGSFTGLVIGFATQQVLGQAVAGIFLLFARPIKHGDKITVAGQTGIVQEIDIMYTTILGDGGKQILIPNGSIIGQVIIKHAQ